MSELVIPIDLGFVNAYLLRAKGGFVLVDTGLGGQLPRLEAGLEAAGCAKGSLKLIVLTHADRDHSGNAAALAAEFGVPIAIHEGDKSALELGIAPERHGRNALISLLMALRRKSKGAGAVRGPHADILLADGASLTEYGLEARVLHLPGHTPGSIALLLGDGSLVAGDVFSNRKRPGLSPFIWCSEEYGASLERLKAMASSIATVYPGHGSPFAGAAIRGMRL
jgi:hydroxyacylglutathione hydrolase